MGWLEIHIDIDHPGVNDVCALLTEIGAIAVTCQNAGNTPIFEPAREQAPLWATTTVTGMFEESVNLERLLLTLQSQSSTICPNGYRLSNLADQDWHRAWMDQFRPLHFRGDIWIVPSWHKPPAHAHTVIMLDPGLAFGTGMHPTTGLCIDWLGNTDLLQKRVIDYGCGSGILAMVAAKQGANHVWAVDHDLQALQVTRGNADKNDIHHLITAATPGKLKSLAGKIDVLIANILADPLMCLASSFAEYLRCGGNMVISGILKQQEKTLCEHYSRWFEMNRIDEQEGWVLLAGIRHD